MAGILYGEDAQKTEKADEGRETKPKISVKFSSNGYWNEVHKDSTGESPYKYPARSFLTIGVKSDDGTRRVYTIGDYQEDKNNDHKPCIFSIEDNGEMKVRLISEKIVEEKYGDLYRKVKGAFIRKHVEDLTKLLESGECKVEIDTFNCPLGNKHNDRVMLRVKSKDGRVYSFDQYSEGGNVSFSFGKEGGEAEEEIRILKDPSNKELLEKDLIGVALKKKFPKSKDGEKPEDIETLLKNALEAINSKN
ncbi:hypothetical protein HYW76_01435 [Candidatus Pacearchaeota archaeon]|nr:hypothetical protein [Candidatus Pacearchaeota archaeon]